MSFIISEIAVERQRQIEQEGWSLEHDDGHRDGELAAAAGCYALSASGRRTLEFIYDAAGHALPRWHWPWNGEWWKPKNKRRDLIRAAALIVAEIERLDRAALASTHSKRDQAQ